MPESHIERCPFCGAWEVICKELGPDSFATPELKPPHVWVCICQCCFAVGPPASTKAGAIELWNTRHPKGN